MGLVGRIPSLPKSDQMSRGAASFKMITVNQCERVYSGHVAIENYQAAPIPHATQMHTNVALKTHRAFLGPKDEKKSDITSL